MYLAARFAGSSDQLHAATGQLRPGLTFAAQSVELSLPGVAGETVDPARKRPVDVLTVLNTAPLLVYFATVPCFFWTS